MSDSASPIADAAVVRPPFHSRLRARLLALVLLAILPALGLVLYTGLEQRRQAREEAKANARRLVKLAASVQRQHVEASRQILGTLAQLPQVRPERFAECNAIFSTLLELHQVYLNFGAVDAHGRVFASAQSAEMQADLSRRSDFQLARKSGRFAVGDYQIGRQNGRPSLNMAQPLRDNGTFRGAVFASLDLRWLHQMAARSDLPDGATLTLVDRNGTILVRYQNPAPTGDWVGISLANHPAFRRLLSEGSDLTGEGLGLDGVMRLYATTPLSRSGGLPDAYVFVGIPISAAYAAANRMMRQNSLFLGIVAVLALAAAWVGGDLFVLRQVHGLVEAARRLARGDLRARSGVAPGPGELGQLAASFDDMAAALERQVGELEKARAELQTFNEQLEQRVLERTLELRRSNEDLEQFAYVASHDLKEPLRMVKSYLDLLRSRHGAQLEPKAAEFIEASLDGARRMEGLIDDLLAYARVGRAGKELEPTDTNAACERALANLQKAIADSQAEVIRDALPMVRGDITLLAQLFQNLIGNALKFCGEAPPRVRITAERKGLEWEFAVRDNGIGISPQDFERVFVVFQRLHARDKYPGTGIGLSVCKKIVERHGGRIWVESRPGQGTTFRFTLPVLDSGPDNA